MNRKSNQERIIEQLDNGVAIVISLQRALKYEEAQEHFAFELERFTHISYPDFVIDVTDGWLESLYHRHGSSVEVIESFGSLLLVGAEMFFECHRITEGFLLVTKCQRLFSIVIANEGDLDADQEHKVERLAILIAKFSN